MQGYEACYYLLFNSVTDALEAMEQQNYGYAKQLLITAQQKAEELWIDAANDELEENYKPER